MIFLQKVVDNSRLCAVKVVVGCFIALFDGKKNSNECWKRDFCANSAAYTHFYVEKNAIEIFITWEFI